MAGTIEVDLAFLGGGVAGYTGAIRARQRGASVAVVEHDHLGGVCLNRGCIPSKALLHSARLAQAIPRAGEFGLKTAAPQVEYAGVARFMQSTVTRLRKGVEHLMKKHQVHVVRGRGRLADARHIEVEGEDGRTAVRADKIIIATGSEPAMIPIPGAAEHTVTSDHIILDLEQMPSQFAVIGGGFIGCELGYALAALGSQVTMFEMMEHILPSVDADVARELTRALTRAGMKIHVSTRVTTIEERGGVKVVRFSNAKGEGEVEADLVLMAVGRRPRLEGTGAAEIGVEIENGRVVVNERMETSVAGVYAAGDVTGEPLLAHTASGEARAAVTNALGGEAKWDARAVPFCVYTWPEVAAVGLTEQQAQEQRIEVRVGTFPFRALGKALASGEREGFVKVLVADGKVVGAHMVGPHATELIAEAAAAIWAGTPVERFAAGIRAHPTLAEATMEAVEDALGHPLHK